MIPATTPIGWKSLQASMFGPTLRLYSPLEDFRGGAGVLDVLDAALSSPAASSRVLPCSSLISLEHARLVLLQQLLEAVQHLCTLGRGVLRQAGKAALAASMAFCRGLARRPAGPVDGFAGGGVRRRRRCGRCRRPFRR